MQNYQWEFEGVTDVPSGICSFYEPLTDYKNNDGRFHTATIFVSSNRDLAKVKVIVNGRCAKEKEVGSCPSMVIIDLNVPDQSYSMEYRYYDKDGNQIHV